MPHAKALQASLLLILGACSSTEPRVPPTADITANGADGPVTVAANAPVHLSWRSENAVSCLVTPGDWSGTTGSATVEDLTTTTTYRLSCTGPGGAAQDSVHIVVPSAPATQIVFESSDGTIPGIYVVNADGSGLSKVMDSGWAPLWSGDGRQIYFLSRNRDGGGTVDLYTMNAAGSDVHVVVPSIYGPYAAGREPYAISPDGTRIAVGLEEYPNRDLFVMNADGSDRIKVLDLPCQYIDAQCERTEALAWSPDGQRIAYSSGYQGHAFIHYNKIGVVNPDGTGQRDLTTFGTRSTEPAWAPDGQRIVFSSSPANPSTISTPTDLEILNVDGTGRMVLLDGDVDGMVNTSPSWSPDGRSIVFARFTPGTDWVAPGESELFAVNVDGTGLRRVTAVPGGAFAPDWNPAEP